MYVITPYQTSVTLFGDSGSVRVFKTLNAALKALGLAWIKKNVGAHFKEFRRCSSLSEVAEAIRNKSPAYRYWPFIMRDDSGKPLTAQHFEPLIKTRNEWFYRYRYALETWDGATPVPYIRKHRGGGHYFRRIRYIGEHRQSIYFPEEGEIGPRGRRTLPNLPNAWDDPQVASLEDRNWKKFRRTQWKHRD